MGDCAGTVAGVTAAGEIGVWGTSMFVLAMSREARPSWLGLAERSRTERSSARFEGFAQEVLVGWNCLDYELGDRNLCAVSDQLRQIDRGTGFSWKKTPHNFWVAGRSIKRQWRTRIHFPGFQIP